MRIMPLPLRLCCASRAAVHRAGRKQVCARVSFQDSSALMYTAFIVNGRQGKEQHS